MTTAARTPTLLTATALPAAEAYDYDYYRARLAHPCVLEQSVAVRALRMPFLAVPMRRPAPWWLLPRTQHAHRPRSVRPARRPTGLHSTAASLVAGSRRLPPGRVGRCTTGRG